MLTPLTCTSYSAIHRNDLDAPNAVGMLRRPALSDGKYDLHTLQLLQIP